MISRYERQGLRRGAVVDGRMPAPRTSPAPSDNKWFSHHYFLIIFQKRLVANTVEE